MEETTWSQQKITLEPGDTLVLYTDGITDALNEKEQFFGQERLHDSLLKYYGKPAGEMHALLFGDVRNWIGNTQQYDDITLMVIVREKG
jgi:sigma-B regulation protein RsbU (phosphoserine phosphatase)